MRDISTSQMKQGQSEVGRAERVLALQELGENGSEGRDGVLHLAIEVPVHSISLSVVSASE